MRAGNRLAESFFNADTQRFFSPAKWFWGPSAVARGAELVSELERPLLVVDAALLAHPVTQSLMTAGNWSDKIIHSGITLTERCRELAPQLADAGAIVTVGGGSAIDTVKTALAEWLYGDLDGVGMGPRRGEAPIIGRKRPLLVCFPSTCGSGAEASRYYVSYRQADRAKVHGKSWALVADWIFGDPAFLRDAPRRLLVETAFDAFVHFWESYLCRHEAGLLSRALAVHGMETILQALPRALAGDCGALTPLIYAGTLGGVAISNVRTGHIHEAAGVLLEACELSHGATLFVFFDAALAQVSPIVAADPTLTSLLERYCGEGPDAVAPLGAWWKSCFDEVGSLASITAELRHRDNPQLRQAISSRVVADRVWCTKESPVALDAAAIERFVSGALDVRRP